MANLKISQLTATTTNTIGSWVVINNSGETTSNKSQLEYVLGMTKGAGASSIKSANFLTQNPSVADTAYSIALGNGASATTAPSIIAIGNGAYSVSENCIVIGKNAHDQGIGRDNGIAIGTDAEIFQPRAISIGKNAGGVTDAITIGTDGRAIANTSIAIGASTVVAGDYGVGIGYDIFQDRANASVIGSQSYVSGLNSTVVGAANLLGQSGGDSEDSTIIGVSNEIYGPYDKCIAIGYNNRTQSDGVTVISSAGIGNTGELQGSNASTIIGSSGMTISNTLGTNNIVVGGLNNTISNGLINSGIFGGVGNTFTGGGSYKNNFAFGLSGRTVPGVVENTTIVENLQIYGNLNQFYTTYSASTIDIDIKSVGYANIEATQSGTTYNINVTPDPVDNIGRQLTLFVEWKSGATVNFVSGGNVQWKWNTLWGGSAPVFSATTSGATSRSIIVLSSWDNSDMWEVSRSMNME